MNTGIQDATNLGWKLAWAEHSTEPDTLLESYEIERGPSAQAVFAPDRHAVATQLARACRPGGRIGLTTWRPDGAIASFFAMLTKTSRRDPTAPATRSTGDAPGYVRTLLGGAFELDFAEAESPQLAWSAEPLWTLFTTALGPVKALAASLDDATRAFAPGELDIVRRAHTQILPAPSRRCPMGPECRS